MALCIKNRNSYDKLLHGDIALFVGLCETFHELDKTVFLVQIIHNIINSRHKANAMSTEAWSDANLFQSQSTEGAEVRDIFGVLGEEPECS